MNHFLFFMVGFSLLSCGAPAVAGSSMPASWSPSLQASTEKLLAAGADAGQVMELTVRMVESGYDDDQIIEVQQLIGESGEAGLPSAPLANKAREGLAKKVPAPLLLRAMEQVRNRYREAYRYARSLSEQNIERETLGQLLVDVQAAGLAGPELGRMIAAVHARVGKSGAAGEQQQLIRQSLLLAREMSRQGAAPDLLVNVVSGLLEKGADSEELAEVGAGFAMHRNRLQINEQTRSYLQMLAEQPSMQQFMNSFRQNSATGDGSAARSGRKGSPSSGSGRSAAGEGAGGSGDSQGGQGSGSGQGDGNSGGGSGSGGAGDGNGGNGGNGGGNRGG